jgi:type II secretory pathway pseudopilin PulG
MINPLRFLFNNKLKASKLARSGGGFTLIELVVAMILAGLVITPLMGFMLNIMDSDRKEQAKTTSEQELQVALDYIAQDLQQAVYIYDGEGVAAIKDQLPHSNDATKVPVLVFWKRQVIKDAIRYDGQLCTDNDVTSGDCEDSFVYSLVAYYLIKDNQGKDVIWYGAARIGRFQIKDGVQNPNYPVDNYGNPRYVEGHEPDKGFKLFDLDAEGNTLKAKMNQWEKDKADYDQPTNVLVDFIDQSTRAVPAAVDCSSTLGLDTSVNDDTLRVTPSSVALNTNSFYACVDSSQTLAQVYIRGNALARISNNQIASDATYSSSRSAYFPTANVRIEGRGFLSAE